MIKDVEPNTRESLSPVKSMRTIVDTRAYLAPDHLVDALARGYALELKTGISLTKEVSRAVTSNLTKVTYG
tara:strand:+ start:484 stop:696 length:213 start_codon:yes stop_codon:yes gene_type:complete